MNLKLKNILPYVDTSQGIKILNYYGNEYTDENGNAMKLYRNQYDIKRIGLMEKEISAITVDTYITGKYGNGTLTIYLDKEV